MPQRPLTVASPHIVYRSNWSERTPEVESILSNINWYQQSWNENIWHKELLGVETEDIINDRYDDIVNIGFGDDYLRKGLEIGFLRLYQIQAFFHLFMRDLPHPFELTEEQRKFNNPKKPFEYTGDPNWELDESLRQDVQPIEKAVLASLFLDRDEIPIKFRYIHDLMHGTPIERFNRSYTLPDHWEIPLPDHTREVSSLGLEEGTIRISDLRTLRTRSYYHINKEELMDRVRKTLSRRLFYDFNNLGQPQIEQQPRTIGEIDELYQRLLDFKGTLMWKEASLMFPEDEVILLWNRSIASQLIDKAWHLSGPHKMFDIKAYLKSDLNFTVTHHRTIIDGDREELIPTLTSVVDDERWTHHQLNKTLGHDWRFDPRLVLEDNWMDTGRNLDYFIVMKINDLFKTISSNLPIDNNYQGGFLIRTNSDHLFLEQSRPDMLKHIKKPKRSFPSFNDVISEDDGIFHQSYERESDFEEMRREFETLESLPSTSLDDDEKELVRQDSDEQPRNPVIREAKFKQSPRYLFFDGSRSIDSVLINGNSFFMGNWEFNNWGHIDIDSCIFPKTSSLQGAYMLNLFFHQSRLDSLYSWYEDIYLSNMRYLREYLRSVNLNESYQLSEDDHDRLTLDDEWQTYIRSSNVFVKAFVENFGKINSPFVELDKPEPTESELNNLKLLRLSLMQRLNHHCFAIQSHFLRSMVDRNYDSEPSFSTLWTTDKELFRGDILDQIQSHNVNFDGFNILDLHPELLEVSESGNFFLSRIKRLLSIREQIFPSSQVDLLLRLEIIRAYQSFLEEDKKWMTATSLNMYSLINKINEKDKEKLRPQLIKSRIKSKQNLWLDYLTLTRFLQDDPSHEDELSWTSYIDAYTEITFERISEHVVTPQEKMDQLMFNDKDCQIHHQLLHDSTSKKDWENFLDKWYLSSENRKVNPNLYNSKLRSLLPTLFLFDLIRIKVIGNTEDLDFLPTNEQLNDPVRFVSSLELANSFFDDYNSRKTWSDEDIDMLERVLTEYNSEDDLSEELSEEFFNYVRQGNCDGMINLLSLIFLIENLRFVVEDQDQSRFIIPTGSSLSLLNYLDNYGVQLLNLRSTIWPLLRLKIMFNTNFSSQGILEIIIQKTLGKEMFRQDCLKTMMYFTDSIEVLGHLRTIEQRINDRSLEIKELITSRAPFLLRFLDKERENQDVRNIVDLKLLFLDDSVIRNIFVRRSMLDRMLSRKISGDKLVLPSLDVERDRQVVNEVIQAFTTIDWRKQVETMSKWVINTAWGNRGVELESDYLGFVLKNLINPKVTTNSIFFSRKVGWFNNRLINYREILPLLSNKLIQILKQQHTLLMINDDVGPIAKVRVWDACNECWVYPKLDNTKVGELIFSEQHCRSIQDKDFHSLIFTFLREKEERERREEETKRREEEERKQAEIEETRRQELESIKEEESLMRQSSSLGLETFLSGDRLSLAIIAEETLESMEDQQLLINL